MDLNMMMRQTAQQSLEAQLDDAVKAGDSDKAKAVTKQIAELAVQTAPKAPAFGDVEIRAELNKQEWFGKDPKKSAKAVEFGKNMDPKKFGTAEAFAKAITDAVDAEFKAPDAGNDTDPEGGDGNDTDPEGEGEPKPKRTDGPKEGDLNGRPRNRTSNGPWVKITDAPADVQKEIKRQADKMLPPNATKEQKEAFTTRQLEAHHRAHVARKGK